MRERGWGRLGEREREREMKAGLRYGYMSTCESTRGRVDTVHATVYVLTLCVFACLHYVHVNRVLMCPCMRLQVGLPAPLVRRKMLFWVNHGVILEGRLGGGSGGSGGGASRGASGGGGGGAASSGGGGGATAAAAAAGDLLYRRAEALPAELQGRFEGRRPGAAGRGGAEWGGMVFGTLVLLTCYGETTPQPEPPTPTTPATPTAPSLPGRRRPQRLRRGGRGARAAAQRRGPSGGGGGALRELHQG